MPTRCCGADAVADNDLLIVFGRHQRHMSKSAVPLLVNVFHDKSWLKPKIVTVPCLPASAIQPTLHKAHLYLHCEENIAFVTENRRKFSSIAIESLIGALPKLNSVTLCIPENDSPITRERLSVSNPTSFSNQLIFVALHRDGKTLTLNVYSDMWREELSVSLPNMFITYNDNKTPNICIMALPTQWLVVMIDGQVFLIDVHGRYSLSRIAIRLCSHNF